MIYKDFVLIIIIVIVLAILDFIMGILASIITNVKISSNKMATGLAKKTENIVAIITFICVDFFIAYCNNIRASPKYSYICLAYITIMELCSMSENYSKGRGKDGNLFNYIIKKILNRKE